MPMEIADLTEPFRDFAAELLVEEFDARYGWPTLAAAREEVERIVRDGFAHAAIEGDDLLGWIGALPEYGGNVWELHPLVVRPGSRRRGVGRRLVSAFEEEARRRGAVTLTLGTDDVAGMTSLSAVDLYHDLPAHLRDLHDLGRSHPFLFFRKLGFVVTGVLPDANGAGKPDIFMSKRA
jgi:aminoglycoside 6'-N-acetyltransferase I